MYFMLDKKIIFKLFEKLFLGIQHCSKKLFVLY